jgi:hypothetical protein
MFFKIIICFSNVAPSTQVLETFDPNDSFSFFYQSIILFLTFYLSKRCMVFSSFSRHEPFEAIALKNIHLFVTGVCSASAVAVSPELRALVAVTTCARLQRKTSAHKLSGTLNALILPLWSLLRQ